MQSTWASCLVAETIIKKVSMFDDLITGNQYKKTLVNHDAKINFLSATFHQQDKLLSVIVVARVLIKVKSQIVLL